MFESIDKEVGGVGGGEGEGECVTKMLKCDVRKSDEKSDAGENVMLTSAS